jgi:small subunit ribosomal protein S20
MANHKSSKKRIRSNEAKRLRNRYYAKTTRNSIKALRAETSVAEATKDLPTVLSNIDKLAKRNIIHKNKAANLKSKLMKKLNALKK